MFGPTGSIVILIGALIIVGWAINGRRSGKLTMPRWAFILLQLGLFLTIFGTVLDLIEEL